MAKRSYTKKHSELEKDEVSIEEDVLLDIETEEIVETHKTLVLMKDIGTLKVTGPVSGNVYVFHGAGSKVEVLIEDVEGLLNKINPNNCCSGTQQQPYFSLE